MSDPKCEVCGEELGWFTGAPIPANQSRLCDECQVAGAVWAAQMALAGVVTMTSKPLTIQGPPVVDYDYDKIAEELVRTDAFNSRVTIAGWDFRIESSAYGEAVTQFRKALADKLRELLGWEQP